MTQSKREHLVPFLVMEVLLISADFSFLDRKLIADSRCYLGRQVTAGSKVNFVFGSKLLVSKQSKFSTFLSSRVTETFLLIEIYAIKSNNHLVSCPYRQYQRLSCWNFKENLSSYGLLCALEQSSDALEVLIFKASKTFRVCTALWRRMTKN